MRLNVTTSKKNLLYRTAVQKAPLKTQQRNKKHDWLRYRSSLKTETTTDQNNSKHRKQTMW